MLTLRIVSIILSILAGFCKSVKDRIDAPKDSHGNYFTQHRLPKTKYFNKGTSKKFFGLLYWDAWHHADWLYISFLILASITWVVYPYPVINPLHSWWMIMFEVLGNAGIVFATSQISFEFNYSFTLKK